MHIPTNTISIIAADSSRMPWTMFTVPQTGAQIPTKVLSDDPETGMQVFLMRYAAGFTNVWHTHPCAHGMFVLTASSARIKVISGQVASSGFPREDGWSTAPPTTTTAPSCSSPTSHSVSATRPTSTTRTRCSRRTRSPTGRYGS